MFTPLNYFEEINQEINKLARSLSILSIVQKSKNSLEEKAAATTALALASKRKAREERKKKRDRWVKPWLEQKNQLGALNTRNNIPDNKDSFLKPLFLASRFL